MATLGQGNDPKFLPPGNTPKRGNAPKLGIITPKSKATTEVITEKTEDIMGSFVNETATDILS